MSPVDFPKIQLTILCIILFAGTAVCQRSVKTDCPASLLRTEAATAAKGSMSEPFWTVKYVSGSLHPDAGSWLRIAFAPRGVTSLTKNLLITVHADQIVSVEYSAKAEKDSDLMQTPRSGCGYARSMMPDLAKSRPDDLIATTATPGRASRFADALIHHDPVHIVWTEEGRQEQITMRINDCEYESFVENLRWLMGTRWAEAARDISK